MADFNLKYPDIPQVIYNGVRQKGVYAGSERFVWPYDEEQISDSEEVYWVPITNIEEWNTVTIDDVIAFIAVQIEDDGSQSVYLIEFFEDQAPTYGDIPLVMADGQIQDMELDLYNGDNPCFFTFWYNGVYPGVRFELRNSDVYANRFFLGLLGSNSNNQVRLITDVSDDLSYADWEFVDRSDGGNDYTLLYPYFIREMMNSERELYVYKSGQRIYAYRQGSSAGADAAIWPIKRVSGNIGHPKTRKYAITLDTNGIGTVSTTLNSGWEWTTYGQLLNPPTPTPENGHTFLYWAYEPEGQTEWREWDLFTSDVTLYAQWKSSPILGDIAQFLALKPTNYTTDDVFSFANANSITMLARSPNGYYVVGDLTGYLLVYDNDMRWHGPYSYFSYLEGNVSQYQGTIELINVSYDVIEQSSIREIFYPDVEYLYSNEENYSNIENDILGGNKYPACQPLRLIVRPQDQANFQYTNNGHYLYVSLPDGTMSILSMDSSGLADYIGMNLPDITEIWIEGFLILWYANYKTMIATNVTFIDRSQTTFDFIYGDY